MGKIEIQHLPRLIPACAGKTTVKAISDNISRAHPRVCGENCGRCFALVALCGSSPRVRGKLGDFIFESHALGLIPACAGKTLNDLEF